MNKDPDFIFGLRPLIEAINSGKHIDKIMVKKGLKGEIYHELILLLKKHGLSYQSVPAERLDRATRKNHQGVIAWLSAIEYQNIENILPAVYEAGRDPLILILDGVSDVRNFGAIARSAECMGVDAIVIPEKKSARINADAVKTSAGALHNIAVVKVKSLRRTIELLKDSGLAVVAASEKSDTGIDRTDLKGPLALVLGGEDMGIDEGILALADIHTTISTSGVISSLNVSVAAGICLYEINRQRSVVHKAQGV